MWAHMLVCSIIWKQITRSSNFNLKISPVKILNISRVEVGVIIFVTNKFNIRLSEFNGKKHNPV